MKATQPKTVSEIQRKVLKDKPKRISKKAFLDNIFGSCKFCVKVARMDLLSELEGDKLGRYLDMSKKARELLLRKRFNNSISLAKLV